MPIRPDLRHLYRGPAWRATRDRILSRAGNKCEQCGKPNGERVWTYNPEASVQWWSRYLVPRAKQLWKRCGEALGDGLVVDPPIELRREALKPIRVKVGVAHLDHNARNNDDGNLRALCDWCHLNYDKLHHRETRSARKDAARPLLHAAQSEANA